MKRQTNRTKLEYFDTATATPANAWEQYKEMINAVYYEQKTRSEDFDKLHQLLSKTGDKFAEEMNPDIAVAFINTLMQAFVEANYARMDTPKISIKEIAEYVPMQVYLYMGAANAGHLANPAITLAVKLIKSSPAAMHSYLS